MLATLLSIAKERGSALATEFSRAWGEGAGGHPAPRIASVVFGILAVFGFISIGRREFLYCDAFAACYAAALLILPPRMASARMEMPLMPLFYLYVAMAVGRRFPRFRALRPIGVGIGCRARRRVLRGVVSTCRF